MTQNTVTIKVPTPDIPKPDPELAQEWLAAIISSSNDPVIGLRLDRTIVSWNRAAEQVFGYTADEIVGKSVALLAPPELHAEQRGIFEKIRRGESVSNHETQRLRKDGVLIDASLTFSPIRDRNQNIVGVSETLRDITARKRALERLYESHQRLNEILETINDGYYAVDAAWHLTYVNQKAERLWHKSRTELLGKNLWEVFPVAVGGPAYLELTAAMREQRHVEFEVFSIDQHGWYELSAYPNRGGLIVYFRDISARKLAEQARRESEELYRTLFDSVDEGFCVLEMIFDEQNNPVDYRFLETNPVFERQTGLEHAQGKTARELVPSLEAHWFEIYGRVALTGEPLRFVDGSEAMGRWFDVYACRVGGPESRKVALLFSDITKRKQAEEYLTQARDALEIRVQERTSELRELMQARQLLLQQIVTAQEQERSRISRELHDQLGQLLTALGLGLSGLRTRGPRDLGFDAEVARLQNLTNLTSNTLQSLAYALRPAALDSLGLVTTLENYLEEWARDNNISAHFEFTGSRALRLPPDVETTIYRIVQEALTNVLRHAHAKNVNLTLSLVQDRFVTIIEDDGHGFDPTSASADPKNSRSFGLVNMRERAEMVGGTLEIESQPAVGTTVFIRIPFSPP